MHEDERGNMKDSLRIGFVGAGKVGFSLGKFFVEGGLTLSGYFSRNPESAREAAEFTGSAAFASLADIAAESDAIIITVPDDAIAGVYKQLCAYDLTGKQICHCSGSLSAAEVFCNLNARDATGYSLHPLFPISSKTESYKELSRACFCIEGSPDHLEEWARRIESLGPKVQLIDGTAKKRYHAACCISSNLVCALAMQSIEMLVSCGFTEENALTAIAPLIRANIEHVIEVGPRDALTGPVERNDVSTVQAHLSCMNDPRQRDLYRLASLGLVEMAQARHPETDYAHMKQTLFSCATSSHA